MKIGDFGYATWETSSFDVKGTPEYWASEIKFENEHIPEKADVYASGILLFAITIFDYPFQIVDYNFIKDKRYEEFW